MTNIPDVIGCALKKFCCLVDSVGQLIQIDREGAETYAADSTIATRSRVTVYNGKGIVQPFTPKKELLGINTSEIAHENVTHKVVVYICPEDTDVFEKDDRVIYRSEEYEVETVSVHDPAGIIVYYKLICVKIEND